LAENGGTLVRDQINSVILAPIFLILTVGMRNIIVRNTPMENAPNNLSIWKIAINNNLHILWFLVVANETFSQAAFAGFNHTGEALPEANTVWILVRTFVYAVLLVLDLWQWIKTKDKSSVNSKVSVMLLVTESLAIYFALIFLNI
jgi:hypothetical protein